MLLPGARIWLIKFSSLVSDVSVCSEKLDYDNDLTHGGFKIVCNWLTDWMQQTYIHIG